MKISVFLCNFAARMMKIDDRTGLVLEGGGMRGVFTSGVLDAFMEHGLTFPYIVAVSAGACNGLSYVSHQPKRAKFSNIDMLEKYDYIGLRHLLKKGCIFDPDLLYDELPYKIFPFDFDTFFHSPTTFEMVVTNCQTGLAEYLSERNDRQRLLDIVQASSSLPYVSKIVMVDGKPMLDGGIVDSIPLERAISKGFSKNVVILTRNRGYRKTGRDHKVPHFIYHSYPRLRVALSRRLETYNRQLEFVEQLEAEGRVLCIRPEQPLEVDRIEKDVHKLERLYDEGLQLGHDFCRKHLKKGKQ